MNKYRKLKTVLYNNIRDEKIPFNNKIFLWFLSIIFFNFFFKKKISNDVAYFDYLFSNSTLKDHSALSDIALRVGWNSLKDNSKNSFRQYSYPDNDLPNQQFFSQTRKMQGIVDTGLSNEDSELLQLDEYKNNSVFAQPGSFVPLIYDSNPLEDTQFIEKTSSIYRLHWTSFFFSMLIYGLEIFSIFFILYFSLDFYIYFDGFCWNIFELSLQYPSRFVWLNFNLGSYFFNIYKILPIFFKVIILFIWHIWSYSKFLFFVFFLVFVNFFYVFFNIIFIVLYNLYLKLKNLSLNPSSDGYYGDFSHLDFSENAPEFSTKGSSLFRATDNNLGLDSPFGEATQLTRGHIEDEELANEFFIFYRDKENILKMRPLSEFVFFFKSFLLIFFFFFWYIILFLFLIFTLNYFFFSVFRFMLYNDVYKYTLFNYFFGHFNFFPLLDWFYQFEIKIKKAYNQRFFIERYTNYIFSKGYSKLHYLFIKKEEINNLKLKKFFGEISNYNKEIIFPRRMKSKRYFYRSLTPHIVDIDKYFKNGIASKRILFDFVFFKHFTSFQSKIPYFPTKDNVNYYLPNKTRLWIINARFKDFFNYIYDFFTGSFFFSYIQFTNFKFFKIDDLTISRLLQVTPQDDNIYNEVFKKKVIYSDYYDVADIKNSSILKLQNSKKIVSDIFMDSFIYYGQSKSPEVFYSSNLYNQNKMSLNKIMQEYYKYVFFLKNSYKKDYYNNLFRLNLKFEELFESLEHETDLFFDFSKRNMNASDLDNYLDYYWKQYTTLRDYRSKKIKNTMKINNFFIRSRLQFLKIFSKFDFVGTSFLFDSDEHRKLYDTFNFYKVKYLKKFLRFYGLFQFNSLLRKNKYLIINNFFKNYDLIKFRYFKNLELWKVFQFRTSFQHIFNRLNSRSFLGYYCNNNSTFPYVKYRDHFKKDLRRETTKWMITPLKEEKEGYAEEKFNAKKTVSGFPMGIQKRVTPLSYIFYYDNDSWRNYKYNVKQKLIDSSPKFLASSSYFSSYYYLIKYLPKETFKYNINNNFIFNSNMNKNFFIDFIFDDFFNYIFWFKNKVWFIFLIWQWFFFVFVVFFFNIFSGESSFKYSNYDYSFKNLKESIFVLNFIISFFVFSFFCFLFVGFAIGLIKTINYFSNDFFHYFTIKVFSNLNKNSIFKNIFNLDILNYSYINVYFVFYITICFLIYIIFFNNFFLTYYKNDKNNKHKYFNLRFLDFSIINLNFTKFFSKKNSEIKIFNSIEQISFYKSYKIIKKKKK